MASSTSTQDHHHHHHFPTTTAPPPTPSTTQPTTTSPSPSTDLLSRLLHRLPPSLSTTTSTPSLLRRRSSLSTTTSPPSIPFTNLTSTLSTTLPTISQLGYFQLTHHSIPSELAHSAESDSVTIFNLSTHQKHAYFPTTWPLGFDDDDDDDDDVTGTGDSSLFLDSLCSTESSELELSSLREFTSEMEKVGLAVVEALTCALGLRNHVFLDGPDGVSTLMWISENSSFEKVGGSGRFYPYVVGLHYQIRRQSCSLLTDTGLVSVLPEMDSILVTLGDIAQVWSNGNLKKVRGKPNLSTDERSDAASISMSLLVTLPLESNVSPLISRAVTSGDGCTDHHDNENEDVCEEGSEERLFGSFSFEDYAWRVYHERVPLKDPLDRYRNKV